tara:strand:+ start:1206 stop:1307 length:102 start_codon:yes stop_codon:yes gene_type:complete
MSKKLNIINNSVIDKDGKVLFILPLKKPLKRGK